MNYPAEFRYTKEHEWVHVEGTTATVGITDHAQHELGDIVYVDLPKVGTSAEAGKVFGSVESVKAVSDLFAPFTGKIVKVNSPLGDSPEYVNEDPYDEGWMIQIALANPDEIKGLMDADTYQTFLREQAE